MKYNNCKKSNNENKSIKKETLNTVSIILAIISIALSFFIGFLAFSIAVSSLIFALININKGKKVSGLIISFYTMFFVLGIAIAVSEMKQNPIAGKYDCTGVDSNTDEYIVSLYLENDGTFTYGHYDKLENNHAKGTYTYEDEKKENYSGDYSYYMVSFNGDKKDFIIDGKSSEKDFNSKMEIGITKNKNKKEAVIIFLNSYNMYYCYER